MRLDKLLIAMNAFLCGMTLEVAVRTHDPVVLAITMIQSMIVLGLLLEA